jgi:hypothetical protein
MRHNSHNITFGCDIIVEGGRKMTRTKKPDNDKPGQLRQYGALNPHPERITEKVFSDSMLDFFDPRDLIQVKYEMLRAVDKEGRHGRHSIRPKQSSNRVE